MWETAANNSVHEWTVRMNQMNHKQFQTFYTPIEKWRLCTFSIDHNRIRGCLHRMWFCIQLYISILLLSYFSSFHYCITSQKRVSRPLWALKKIYFLRAASHISKSKNLLFVNGPIINQMMIIIPIIIYYTNCVVKHIYGFLMCRFRCLGHFLTMHNLICEFGAKTTNWNNAISGHN